ncbi:hypothetical protein [Hyperthermus butylicus]|uniref:hypothetical protein n=1 Tax=Hyperthermus butylicus TaxID=54248 RepID=UPI00129B00A0|nr:hypothetical protein [Hyperthermus butylicus]
MAEEAIHIADHPVMVIGPAKAYCGTLRSTKRPKYLLHNLLPRLEMVTSYAFTIAEHSSTEVVLLHMLEEGEIAA